MCRRKIPSCKGKRLVNQENKWIYVYTLRNDHLHKVLNLHAYGEHMSSYQNPHFRYDCASITFNEQRDIYA